MLYEVFWGLIPHPFQPLFFFKNPPFPWVSGGCLEGSLESMGKAALENVCMAQRRGVGPLNLGKVFAAPVGIQNPDAGRTGRTRTQVAWVA